MVGGLKTYHSLTSKCMSLPGEVSAMLETCGDQLVAAAMGRDSSAVARCNGDVLGWTSHLGEVSLSLLEHCHHAARKR